MRRGISVRGLASAITLSALVCTPFGLWSFGIQPPGIARMATPPPAIAAIRGMSHLVPLSVHVSDCLEGRNATHKGKWYIHGEVLIGVDLSRAEYAAVHMETKDAVLRLPPPSVISSKVDHEHSGELVVQAVGWDWGWLSNPQALRDDAWKNADAKIRRIGGEQTNIDQARQQAERVLTDFFGKAGWRVRVEWKDGGNTVPAKEGAYEALAERRGGDGGLPRPATVGGPTAAAIAPPAGR